MGWIESIDRAAHEHKFIAALIGLVLALVLSTTLNTMLRARRRTLAIVLRSALALLLLWPLYRLGGNGIRALVDHEYRGGATGTGAFLALVPTYLLFVYLDNLIAIVHPRRSTLMSDLMDRVLGLPRK